MYRWIDHTAEMALEIGATSEAAVFADALAALGELLGDEPGGSRAAHEVEARAPDRAALLAEWLSELLYLAETEAFVPERVVSLALGDGELRATVEGREDAPRPLVKAVTYHGLSFALEGDAWRATVVFDV